MKHFIFTLMLLTAVVTADARGRQRVLREGEYPRLRFGVEAGLETFYGDLNKPDAIRETQSYVNYGANWYNGDYYYGCGYVNRRSDFENLYMGLKADYALTNRLEVSGGLRVKTGNCTLSSNRNFFLWKTAETETETNYVRINQISQRTINLGMPVEVKWFIPHSDHRVAPYLTLGLVNNFHLYNNMKVDFTDANMNKYENTVKDAFPTINVYYAQCFVGAGIKMGRRNQPFGTLAITMPVFLQRNPPCVSSLFNVESHAIFNLSATLYIPVGKKKIVYQYY